MLPLFTQAQNKDYRIYAVAKQQEITVSQLVSELKQADVIFFGEEHQDSIAHLLELALLKGLHQQQPKVTLSMEMFQTDVQPILNEYLQDLISEKNMIQEARAWSNYKDYSPLVAYAKKQGIPILAANAPSRYTNRVTRLGLQSLSQLSEDAKAWLAPLPIDTLTGAYYEKFVSLLGGHSSLGSFQLYQSQNLWDATMAWQLATHKKLQQQQQILHINGKFHSDERLGTYLQLQRYAPQYKLQTISCMPVEAYPPPAWQQWQSIADYIILTQSATID